MNLNIPEILKCYHYVDADRTKLYREYEVRSEQIEFWAIQSGWRILEVGCWAGDMSIMLAAAAGEQGQVVAVDILPADSPTDPYVTGSPTLKDGTDVVKASWLGPRIEFRLGTDLMDETVQYPDRHFDMVVFNQSSFYLTSPDLLGRLFARLRPWASRLGYYEFDLRPDSLAQVPHILGLLLKSQLMLVGVSVELAGNARSLILPEDARRMAEENGWHITAQRRVESSQYLQDGIEWDPPLSVYLARQYLDGRDKAKWTHLDHLIASQARLLEQFSDQVEKRSLFTHAFLAV